jgi:NAD(P)-dependent dehydrogenase (short-subunit alcohol dehydrogenase family)
VGTGVLVAAIWLIPRAQPPMIFVGAATAILAAGLLGRDDDTDEEGEPDMNGRVAIVTGVGARGQAGYVIAERFLRAGARVVVSGRSPEVETIAHELGSPDKVIGIVADLLSDDDVDRLIDSARQRFGRLDALVNVAGGLTVIKALADTTPAEWRSEIERNAETTLRTCRAALPLLREHGGAIVNFAAPAGQRAVRNLGAYSAAKAAVVALTRALALEEKGFGVRVNAIAPGLIDTEQNRSQAEPGESKFVTREEIAEVVLFLAGDAASGVSGETIHVLGEGLR